MRSRKRTRRNPDWSWNLLDDIWPQLQARVSERLMPIPEQILVEARNPRVREHGEGFFGVVMPTHDPRWVFKLTRDASEAHFVNAIRRMGLRCSLTGIARYSPVYNTGLAQPSSTSSGQVYALWREAADVAGIGVWEAFANTPRRTMAKHAAGRVRDLIDALRDFHAERSKKTLQQARIMLQGCAQNGLLADAAEDLLALMNKGIVVTDVHLGNWGVVPRRPKVLTLIDPGMVVYLTGKARTLATGIPLL